jgi:hypothetical protein
MKATTKLALALFVAGSVGGGADIAKAADPDDWENPPPASLHDCSSIDESLVVPVPLAQRSEATGRLDDVTLVELTPKEVLAFLGSTPEAGSSGLDRIRKAAERLKEQRREELEDHHGSWSISDQQRFDNLSKMMTDRSASDLRPYLVRAVAKNEGTGAFLASLCGEGLEIIHVSLGHSTPPTVRAPVIVFLQTKPAAIYAGWSMAE